MKRSDRALVIALLERAAEAWAHGDVNRAAEWCRRAWITAAGRDFIDLDAEADR
jgi:hypothetical protein